MKRELFSMQRLLRTRVTGFGFRGCSFAHSEASLLPQNENDVVVVQQRQRWYFRDHSRRSIFYFYKKPVVFECGTCDPVGGSMAEAIQGIRNGTPLGAVLTTPEIAQLLTHRSYFNTSGGNPLCTSTGHAILRVLEKEKLQENAFSVGSYLKQPLDSLKEKYKCDVRGRGLMLDVEIFTDRHFKTPAKTEIPHVMEQMKDVGVHIGGGGFHGNVFRITPPLCFRREDAGNCWPAQELIGCDKIENQGCNGGLMEFEFIKKNGDIYTKKNYIYTAEDGTCEAQKEEYINGITDGDDIRGDKRKQPALLRLALDDVENSNAVSSDGHESHDSNSDFERFDFDEKDLESDDSLWALYERWQKHYRVSRGLKEKQKRFNVFKKKAKYTHQFNKESGEDEDSCKLGLNIFGDMSFKEFSSKYCGANLSNYCDAIPSNYYGALVQHSPKLKPNSTYGSGWKVRRKKKRASRSKSLKTY